MKHVTLSAILGALLAMSSACAQVAAPAPTAVVKVSVLASGNLLLNGQPSDMTEIDEALQRQKKAGGSVWYYRENGQAEPPPQAMSVMRLIIDHRPPVSMSSRADFSDYIDDNGHVHPREP